MIGNTLKNYTELLKILLAKYALKYSKYPRELKTKQNNSAIYTCLSKFFYKTQSQRYILRRA